MYNYDQLLVQIIFYKLIYPAGHAFAYYGNFEAGTRSQITSGSYSSYLLIDAMDWVILALTGENEDMRIMNKPVDQHGGEGGCRQTK